MPLPPGLSTVTVTGTYKHPDGTPLTGRLIFQPEPAILTSAAHGTLILGTAEAALDVNGAFTATLLATDDPDVTPAGWTYRVTERWYDAVGRDYPLSLPAAAPTVDLADVAPTAPSVGEYIVVTGPQPPLGAAGAGPTIALRSDDPTTTNARTPLAHAASHTSGGSDEIPVAQSQVTGLAAALAALLPKTGGPVTGTLVIVDGQLLVDSSGTAINAVDRGSTSNYAAYVFATAGTDRWAWQMIPGSSDLLLTDSANGVDVLRVLPSPTNPTVRASADVVLAGTGKAYRFRRSGSNLDLEGAGVDMILSVWSAGDFTGTQHSYDRYSADAANVQHAGRREYVTALYGGAVHTIDPDAGTASFGGKNGLTAIRLAGFKNSAGAPTTNAWAAGDVVLDSVGAWHLCTASGTPGTWT